MKMIEYKILTGEQVINEGYPLPLDFDKEYLCSYLYRIEGYEQYKTYLGRDIMRPEDTSFNRDLEFMIDEINYLANELNESEHLIGEMEDTIDHLTCIIGNPQDD
jgi:hypothetical protein